MRSPVLLFVYNRPEHTARILKEILSQRDVEGVRLYVYSDGSRGGEDDVRVEQVRQICNQAKQTAPNTHRIVLIERSENRGLSHSIVSGLEERFREDATAIVLEDDLHLSPYCLRWMDDALRLYEEVPQVAHICAGTFYTDLSLPRGFLIGHIGSWGWGTWRDRWQELWQSDGRVLLSAFQKAPKEYRERFRYGGYYDFLPMLEAQIRGENDSWAVRWHASLVLNDRLSYCPSPAMATNVGFDGSGTHCTNDQRYRTEVCAYPIEVVKLNPIVQDAKARKVLERYYARTNNKLAKGYYRLRGVLHRVFDSFGK